AFTLGNQTVTIPAGAGNAIEYEYGNGYEGELPDVVATAGDGQVTLTWPVPGGLLVIRYSIFVIDMSTEANELVDIVELEAEALSYICTGLTNGTEYAFILIINSNNGFIALDPVTATPTAK
ncbi:MAG: fibronectin type III domain-containing protein, partial [Firmicutes bacterium]|nr:fibronectin type III domain-containing protein [Bacillota bacterium]